MGSPLLVLAMTLLAACSTSCQHAKKEHPLTASTSILLEAITPSVLVQASQSPSKSYAVIEHIYARWGELSDSNNSVISIGEASCRAMAWCCAGEYVSDFASTLITHELLCRFGPQVGVRRSTNLGYDVMYESDVAAAERVGDLVTATGTIVGNQALCSDSRELVSICRDGFVLHLVFIPESGENDSQQHADIQKRNAPLLEQFGCLFYATGLSTNACSDQERIKHTYGISRSTLLRCD